jgi:hypothetical protein
VSSCAPLTSSGYRSLIVVEIGHIAALTCFEKQSEDISEDGESLNGVPEVAENGGLANLCLLPT